MFCFVSMNEKDVIKTFEGLFETFPSLKFLPIYAWGKKRDGKPFEMNLIEWRFSTIGELLYLTDSTKELLLRIDKESDENVYNYNFNRTTVANYYGFDGRGGMCIVIFKNEEGNLKVEARDCDSLN